VTDNGSITPLPHLASDADLRQRESRRSAFPNEWKLSRQGKRRECRHERIRASKTSLLVDGCKRWFCR